MAYSILHPPLFHFQALKLKHSNFLPPKFHNQIRNSRLSASLSTSSDWEREEVRWIKEEKRWVREEHRWIREESRWGSERESLFKEIEILRLKIESLKRGNSLDVEVVIGGEGSAIPGVMTVDELTFEEKEVESSATEMNVSKEEVVWDKTTKEKVLRMVVEEDDSKNSQEATNGASTACVSKTTDVYKKIIKENSEDKFQESLNRVFLLGENRWEEPSRLKERERFISGSKNSINCLTCHGEGSIICIECDGTGEPNIEPQVKPGLTSLKCIYQ